MANNKTKKHTKKIQTKIMTIPQLRKAFEQLNVKTKHILSKHPINDESIKEFQTTWKQTFGKSLEHNTAESYLLLQSKQKNQFKKTRKQRGGMAPLDYTTRPGIDGSHGTFLPYISSGFKFYNDINNIAMDSGCGKEDITPVLSADMGSNKVQNGGLFSGRLIPPTTPPSVFQDLQDNMLGRKLGNSPDVTQTQYKGKY